MIRQLFEKLEKENLMLSSVESLTGGLFAASLTAVSGASKVFAGGTITYSNEAKILFGVKKETIDQHGAISIEAAKEMAQACTKHFSSQVAISFTGNAGPSASEGKPVGQVFITIVINDKVFNYRLALDGDRAMIREQCVNFGIKTIYDKLNALYPEPEYEEEKEEVQEASEQPKEVEAPAEESEKVE